MQAEIAGPADAVAPVDDASAPLLRRNRARGVMPDWSSGLPRHRHEGEIPHDIEIAALEAMEEVIRRPLDDVA